MQHETISFILNVLHDVQSVVTKLSQPAPPHNSDEATEQELDEYNAFYYTVEERVMYDTASLAPSEKLHHSDPGGFFNTQAYQLDESAAPTERRALWPDHVEEQELEHESEHEEPEDEKPESRSEPVHASISFANCQNQANARSQ